MGRSLSAQYAVLFSRPWPVWGSAILVATVNVFLFAFDRPWTASDGMRNWGDWVLTGLGVVRRADLLAPWLYSGSLLNAGVLLGGDRKSTRLNSSHLVISYAVFCLKKKNKN